MSEAKHDAITTIAEAASIFAAEPRQPDSGNILLVQMFVDKLTCANAHPRR